MAVELNSTVPHQFQSWSFEKAMLEADRRSPSEGSTPDYYNAEENLQIAPTMEELKKTLEGEKAPMLDERYLSSEEDLSPLEHDVSDAEDDEEWYEADFAKPYTFGSCDMAIAVCIISVGRPKVVDVECPSPSSISSARFQRPSRTSSLQARDGPPSPTLPVRKRPQASLRPKVPATSFEPLTKLQTIPSTSSLTRPATSHTNTPIYATPPTNTLYHSSVQSLSATSTPAFLATDPFESSSPAKFTPSKPNHSRFRSLSQKITRLTTNSSPTTEPQSEQTAPKKQMFGKKSVLTRKSSVLQSPLSVQPQQAAYESERASPPPRPTIKRKMVARGAAERAPPIELPPFPGDDDLEMRAYMGSLGSDEYLPQSRARRKSLLGF